MDLFTAKSDLDLSVNFSNDMDGQFARFDQISVIRKLTKVLRKHQSKYCLRQNFLQISPNISFSAVQVH
jgi:hypothetical protein